MSQNSNGRLTYLLQGWRLTLGGYHNFLHWARNFDGWVWHTRGGIYHILQSVSALQLEMYGTTNPR